MKNLSLLPTILLITNDPLLIEGIRAFSKRGFYILECTTVSEALKTAMTYSCDLVVLDEKIDPQDLLNTCQEIRKTVAINHVPLLLVTGNFKIHFRKKARHMGVNDFLATPIDEEELLQVLNRALDQKNREKQITQIALQKQNPFLQEKKEFPSHLFLEPKKDDDA